MTSIVDCSGAGGETPRLRHTPNASSLENVAKSVCPRPVVPDLRILGLHGKTRILFGLSCEECIVPFARTLEVVADPARTRYNRDGRCTLVELT